MTNIEISEDSKEESAEKHQKMIFTFQKDQHDDRIIIYTDGSKSETNQIGAGLVYTTNFSCYQWKAWNLGSKCEVFDAELFAIKKAINFAYEKRTYGHEKSGGCDGLTPVRGTPYEPLGFF